MQITVIRTFSNIFQSADSLTLLFKYYISMQMSDAFALRKILNIAQLVIELKN